MKSNELKKKAYKLVILQGIQQKEVAEMLGVAENTIYRWAKTYNWRKQHIEFDATAKNIMEIMSDICKIENNELRNSITDKLQKMISITLYIDD